MTTNQNALFLQNALPVGARFPLLADVLIPSASPDSCRVIGTLLKTTSTSLRQAEPVSYAENRPGRPSYKRFGLASCDGRGRAGSEACAIDVPAECPTPS